MVNALTAENVPSPEATPVMKERIQKLRELVSTGLGLESKEQKEQLMSLLEEFHDIFNIQDGERGETNLVEMTIDTGDAMPKKQSM